MSRFSELKAQGRFVRFPTPRSRIKGASSRGRTATNAPSGEALPNDERKPTHDEAVGPVTERAANQAKPSGSERPVNIKAVIFAACLLGLPVIAAFKAPKMNAENAAQVAPTSATAVNLSGKWEIVRQKDAMSDVSSVTVGLLAEGSSQSDRPAFAIMCSRHATAVVVSFHRYLGAKKSGDFSWKEIVVRIGDGKPTNEEWEVASNGTTMVRVDFGDSMDLNFVKALRANEKLALRVEPYAENRFTVSFDTRGLTEALKQARPECDWHLKDVVLAETRANGAMGSQPLHNSK